MNNEDNNIEIIEDEPKKEYFTKVYDDGYFFKSIERTK